MPYRFTFIPEIVLALQSIEAARTRVQMIVLPPTVAEGLRLRARIRSTHFSTRIEGNRLTLVEAEEVLIEGREFPGRERETPWKSSAISRHWHRLKNGWNKVWTLLKSGSAGYMC